MTTPEPFYCPSCAGAQMLNHPAGILTYRHTNGCGLRDLEDARKVADLEAAVELGATFTRPATVTEKLLLASQGFTVPDDLLTSVEFLTVSAAVALRTWPALEAV